MQKNKERKDDLEPIFSPYFADNFTKPSIRILLFLNRKINFNTGLGI